MTSVDSNTCVTMNPMENKKDFWMFHGKATVNLDGKWMLFFINSDMDKAWKKATELYDKGCLPGIPLMKCSTAKENPRSSSAAQKVIIFYCGPSHEEEKMMKIGKQLVDAMRYKCPGCNFIYFKSNAQTAVGTAATGAKRNYLYKLQVEKITLSLKENEEALPMKTATEHQLVFTEEKSKYENNIAGLPAVRMHFKSADLDRNWLKAKNLLKTKSLPGCVGLKSETAISSPRKGPFPAKRMQFVFGGDIEDDATTTEFATNIVKFMGTEAQDDTVGFFKFNGKKPLLSVPVVRI